MAKGVLIAAMDFSNVGADEFNDWYDTEHIPERQRVPGFLTLQRWIGAENPSQSVATATTCARKLSLTSTGNQRIALLHSQKRPHENGPNAGGEM
jgi:hypothetical protein